ncbi:type II restriction endonuclease [Naumannella huperziae]
MARLSDTIVGVVAKRLTAVETDPNRSNQHEFNGGLSMISLLGPERQTFATKFVYLDADEDQEIEFGTTTWYDSRQNHPTRTEYRLYYPTHVQLTAGVRAGDACFIILTISRELLIVYVAAGSEFIGQLSWLFDVELVGEKAVGNSMTEGSASGLVERMILDVLGVAEPEIDAPDALTELSKHIDITDFPSTSRFSEVARLITQDSNSSSDDLLKAWLDQEERLFRALEHHLIQERLRQGFVNDDTVSVDEFVSAALTVINRRKSRAGHSLENHVQAMFELRGAQYSRQPVTEGRSRPDFILPGSSHYGDDDFPVERLTVLGVKTSVKDRWRQVLAEAQRVERRFLLTIQPSVTTHQTDEMRHRGVQLVVPRPLHTGYTDEQQDWLWDVEDLLGHALRNQS